MVDLLEAQRIVLEECKKLSETNSAWRDTHIVHEDTEDHAWGWVFYVESESTGDKDDLYWAFMVNRKTGSAVPVKPGGTLFAIDSLGWRESSP